MLFCLFSHRAAGRRRDMTPCTPPSSPCDEYPHTGVSSGDAAHKNLVTINLILVDKTSPEFATVYNNVSNAVLHLFHISTVTFQLVIKIWDNSSVGYELRCLLVLMQSQLVHIQPSFWKAIGPKCVSIVVFSCLLNRSTPMWILISIAWNWLSIKKHGWWFLIFSEWVPKFSHLSSNGKLT